MFNNCIFDYLLFIDDHVPDTTQMLMNIGHVLKNALLSVAGQINVLKKDNETLKVDLAKNQEYLVDLIRMVNNKGFNNEDKSYFDRSNLKIPVKNFEELKALESNDEQKKILAQVLRRNGKSFDSKRTTYQMLKILMDNRVAELLNVDGKRGIKLAFVKMDLYTISIDSVKHLFPDEPVPLIKNQISDWLKQAPRRK
ncbi:uncharacterized protein LOC132933078 [Metopolophium dirhodum]|uniref:uncharacterized protein LOC132933078 n=1 Tax=Metopolophium dirhodum TaxID=44670 RepID=UPI00298FB2AD|nr:uncharacterized protein LOC132933078 [Metopolophium dirhodum]